MDLVFIFEWLDASLLADVSKSSAGVFALVQTVHISSMVVLIGMILLGDLRMLNVLLTEVPSEIVLRNTRKWIFFGLMFIVLSGIYEASAIAMKLAYNTFFFAKMAGLAMGVLFLLTIRNAVYARAPAGNSHGELSDTTHTEKLSPWIVKLVAVTSLVIWLSVAANGRWIGFS
jgi:hypothetical protein